MQKSKKYEWKNSNMALFGSKAERIVKKSAAESEAAWQPVLKCNSNQLFVWRVEQFAVQPWPTEDYGKFYNADSYIVLRVQQQPGGNELKYDVHFWIGKHSTQDEYCTAAYKTVELDTLLDDKAVQHREVQAQESELFKSYFQSIVYLKGGCASGFRHVGAEKYQPRLLHFCGSRRRVQLKEVKLSRRALTSADVFVLDLGAKAIQWNGRDSGKDERVAAAAFLQQLRSARAGRTTTETIDEGGVGEGHEFYASLPNVPCGRKGSVVPPDPRGGRRVLFKLSDESGKLQYSMVAEGSFSASLLTEEDVYVIDDGKELLVYIGAKASKDEKRHALQYAHDYLKTTQHPLVPVTVCRSGQACDRLQAMLKDG